jgi:SagB-type dehydrogenase family enzyme
LDSVFEYHQRSKHQFNRYAPSLGYTDWDCQPEAFRRYAHAPLRPLPRPEPQSQPTFDALHEAGAVPAQPFSVAMLGRLFFDSFALSGWVTSNGKHWPLRCIPSAGGMHPTEVYLWCYGLEELSPDPALFHYNAYEHSLELRGTLEEEVWKQLLGDLPASALLFGFTSIHWRSSWKFGERAYRFCQHDLGHALGALAYAAATVGWHACILPIADPDLQCLLGVSGQEGPEAEQPGFLVAVTPEPLDRALAAAWRFPAEVREPLLEDRLPNRPNALSNRHHPWPAIDTIGLACLENSLVERPLQPPPPAEPISGPRPDSADVLFRRRRSAARMDGNHGISLESFLRICRRLGPGKLPQSALPYEPAIHLLLFVHRVQDLAPGIYALPRTKNGMQLLKETLKRMPDWQRPPGISGLPLFQIQPGDAQISARVLSCNQTLASGSAFMVCMLADFESRLNRFGPGEYRRLHWEAGLLGQTLYMEAEAAGLSGVGIGCFIDDAVHQQFGMHGNTMQVLYHFAVGGSVEDSAIERHPAYAHLDSRD